MIKKLLFFVVVLPISAYVFVEEGEDMANDGGWYAPYMQKARVFSNRHLSWAQGPYAEVKGMLASAKEELKAGDIFTNAEQAVIERNTAAANRAKDLQEKTGLKGTSMNMDQVVESGDLHYEVKDFNDIHEEIKQ
ncbi:MAG: hypothetical protein R3A80_08530 [Bdellovibrionota bacterium]